MILPLFKIESLRSTRVRIESAVRVLIRPLIDNNESVVNTPLLLIVLEFTVFSVDVPLTFSLEILAESVTLMR